MRGWLSRAISQPAIAVGLLSALAVTAGCRWRAGEAAPEPVRVLDTADALSEMERRSIESYLEFVATAALFEGIDRLTPETRVRLRTILVPQATPEECVRLEMALMHKGIYFRDAPMYDGAWRRANRPDLPARRLEAIAAEWDAPFKIARSGNHAIAYFEGEKAVRWGPHFLRRTDEGWIIDGSSVARYIVYDYSNRWVAVDGDYPYLALIRGVYDMQHGSLRDRGPAWMIRSARGP